MAIYSLSLNTTVVTTTVPSWEIKASAANSPRLMELFLNLGAATASTYGLGRSANSGSTAQTTPVNVLAENPNDPAGQSTCAVAWTTAPTVPVNFFRRAFLPATIGAGVIFTFPRGLIIAPSGSICLWNIAASSASTNIHCVLDE